MAIFFNPNENYLIVTNFKVMYGTLFRQNNLILLPNKAVPFFLLRDRILFKKREKYLLVRCPYNKLVSFYMHKILFNKFQGSNIISEKSDFHWQDCQKIFFPYLNLSLKEDNCKIGNKLASLSFEDFVKILPNVFKLDGHLWPQFWAFHVRWKRFPVMRIKFNKILPIEDKINFLKHDLKINISIQANKTDHESYEKYFTPVSYEIVNELYKNDFLYFGYRTHT